MRQHSVELDHQILIVAGSVVGCQDTISHSSLLCGSLIRLCTSQRFYLSIDISGILYKCFTV